MNNDKLVLHSVLKDQSWSLFLVTDFINAGVVLQGVKHSSSIVGFNDAGKSHDLQDPKLT